MIVVIAGNNGYAIAINGEVIAHNLTRAEAEELHAELGSTLRPVNNGAVTPAKAQLMRYPAKA